MATKSGECVKVVIRCRPMSSVEITSDRENIVEMDTKEGVARVRRPGTQEFKDFTFDAVYDDKTEQPNFYEDTGYFIVENVMDGYNGTIFAYGQTGTGKTHTMVGRDSPDELRGVIPRTFSHIFKNVNTSQNKKFLVRASYLEIYNEEIRDLLSKNPKAKLELKDHPDGGVFVKDLSNLVVKTVDELQKVMNMGQSNRSVASTLMNNESSRSHSIFTMTIETAETGPDGKEHIRVGKMNMVDLAGSERQSKTGASGDTLKEATKINMSLSALGNVISALVDSKTSFIPYRDSKLTRLLQDSLGGNTKTVMCACIGPVDYNYDETLSTLRYAYRAKSIKNKPKINEDPKDAMLRDFQDQIAQLKKQLQEKAQSTKASAPTRKVAAPAQPQAQEPQEQEVIIEKEVVVREKLIEKEVLVEKIVDTGITDEDMASMQRKFEEDKKQMEAQLMAEQAAIEEQKTLADEEKQKLLRDLEEKRQRSLEEAEQHQLMMQKLKAMEDKMLVGSQVMEKAMQQESELKKAEVLMQEKKRQEQRMQEELEQQAEEKINLEEKYSSAEEQVLKMTAKLEKLWNKHKQTQAEIQDLQKEFQDEREDMLETIRELRKEVKLVCLTLESFIPMDQYQHIVEKANYDESTDEWVISNIQLAGNRVRPVRKRILDNGRDASPASGRRGHGEELNREMLQPERPNVYWAYTEDGGAQRAEPRPAPSPSKPHKQRTKSAGRPGTASRKGRGVKSGAVTGAGSMSMSTFLHSPEPEEEDLMASMYPKARGLVKDMG